MHISKCERPRSLSPARKRGTMTKDHVIPNSHKDNWSGYFGPVRQKFKKLQQLWTGPWRIESFCCPLVVNIKHVDKRSRQRVHVDRLIPCITPPPSNAPADEQAATPVDDTQPGSSQAADEPITGTGDQRDVDSQLIDNVPTLSQPPTRIRRRPTALEPYILD